MLEGGKKRLLRLDVTVGKRFESKRRANLASPITRVDDIDTPTLELVGDDDAQKAAEFFLNQGTPDCLRESRISPLAVIKTPTLLKTPKLMDNYSSNQFIQFQQEEEDQQSSTSLQTPVVNVNPSNPLQSYVHEPQPYDDSDYPFQMDVAYQTPIGLPQQHHEPSQPLVKPLTYAPPPSYETLVAPSHQLPATVEEISTHHPFHNPNSPSGSSTSSSQVHSPAGGYTSSQESKRKRSFSDDGSKRNKPTKKQQLDALCDKKKFLENRNQELRDDVSKYERACKRLKTMLYARIQQQRA